MTTLLKTLLIGHVVFGLASLFAFYPVWLGLLKEKLSLTRLQGASFIGLIFIVLSWLMGGYYYVNYYGASVRPVIKAGPYPWAHTVIMEAKEHIFLFLPIMAAVVFLVLLKAGSVLETDRVLRRSLAAVTGLFVVLGIGITLAGVIVSGAVR